jgi:hypothetical protein
LISYSMVSCGCPYGSEIAYQQNKNKIKLRASSAPRQMSHRSSPEALMNHTTKANTYK